MKKTAKPVQPSPPAPLVWHPLDSASAGGELFKLGDVYRAKVPGGWFVLVTNNARGLLFYPDPGHTWDGGSLPA